MEVILSLFSSSVLGVSSCCIRLNIAFHMQHLFCISSLPQAWPHMKPVPHVCYVHAKGFVCIFIEDLFG